MNSYGWRLNPVAILAAGIGLVGLFLPWWGIDITGANIDRARLAWTIWNPPHFNQQAAGATSLYWVFAAFSMTALTLGLVAASLAVVGSLTLIRKYLVTGLVLSSLSLILYAVAVDYVTMSYCLVGSPCVSGPIGTETFRGIRSLTASWGFQIGFYLSILSILVLAAGLLLNRILMTDKTKTTVA